MNLDIIESWGDVLILAGVVAGILASSFALKVVCLSIDNWKSIKWIAAMSAYVITTVGVLVALASVDMRSFGFYSVLTVVQWIVFLSENGMMKRFLRYLRTCLEYKPKPFEYYDSANFLG